MRLLPPEAYQNPGHQDLTFDIHFPDLIEWGNQIVLQKVTLQTQADFLQLQSPEPHHQAFKVLHQIKEIS